MSSRVQVQHRWGAWLVYLVASFVWLGAPTPTRACTPRFSASTRAFVAPPILIDHERGESPLALTDVRLNLRCSGHVDTAECELEATYRVINRSEHPHRSRLAFVGSYLAPPTIETNVPVRYDEFSPDHRQRLPEYLAGVTIVARVIEFTLPSGAEATLQVRGRLSPDRWQDGCTLPQAYRRHRLVSGELGNPELGVMYLWPLGMPFEGRWEYDACIDVSLSSHHEPWARRHRTRVTPGRQCTSASGTGTQFSGPHRLSINFLVPRHLYPGGPFAGVGLDFSSRGVGLRLRAGWEIIAPRWLSTSLSYESDPRVHHDLVLTTEFHWPTTKRSTLFLPAPSVGVGLPVQLWPDMRAGIRSQLSLTWPYVGLVTNLDVFPAKRNEDRRLRASLMLQIAI